MTTPENTDVNMEAVAPPVEENPHVYHEEQPQEVALESGQTDKDHNFAALRDKTDNLEKQLEQSLLQQQQQQELIDALKTQQQPEPPPPEADVDPYGNLAPDEWVTREQSERANKRYAEQAIAKALAEDRAKRAAEELPDRINREHKDFDQVVSKENVEYLKANKPYLAASLAATQDPYAQAMAAYDMIKAHCPSAQVTQDKQRAEKNAQRPGSLDAVGSPRSSDFDPRRMNSDTKAQLWKEMQAAARG